MNYINLHRDIERFQASKANKNVVGINNPLKLISSKTTADIVERFKYIKPIKKEQELSLEATLANIDDEVKAMFNIIYITPRTRLLNVKRAGDNTELGTLTPLFLYAQKVKNGIAYEEWNKKDRFLPFVLGHELNNLLEYDWSTITKPTEEQIIEFREATGWSSNLTSNRGKLFFLDEVKMVSSRCYSKMILQTWIAHPTLRDTRANILDPWDWDNTPKAIGITDDSFPWGEFPKSEEQSSRHRNVEVHIPWD